MKRNITFHIILYLCLIVTGCKGMQSAAETVPVLEEDADGLKTEGPVIYIELDKPSASAGKEPEYMGVFTVSAYCGCSQCLGENRRKLTYAGTSPKAGYTIAADLSEFDLGEKLAIEGNNNVVEDKTAGNRSESLSIYFDSHKEALSFGIREVEVYRFPREESEHEGEYIGEFLLTGYCSCNICCGEDNGDMTYTGAEPRAGRTVAADPDIIPLGSEIEVGGCIYIVEDTGKKIKGNRLDIFFDTHDEAVLYGRRQEPVYLLKQ